MPDLGRLNSLTPVQPISQVLFVRPEWRIHLSYGSPSFRLRQAIAFIFFPRTLNENQKRLTTFYCEKEIDEAHLWKLRLQGMERRRNEERLSQEWEQTPTWLKAAHVSKNIFIGTIKFMIQIPVYIFKTCTQGGIQYGRTNNDIYREIDGSHAY